MDYYKRKKYQEPEKYTKHDLPIEILEQPSDLENALRRLRRKTRLPKSKDKWNLTKRI